MSILVNTVEVLLGSESTSHSGREVACILSAVKVMYLLIMYGAKVDDNARGVLASIISHPSLGRQSGIIDCVAKIIGHAKDDDLLSHYLYTIEHLFTTVSQSDGMDIDEAHGKLGPSSPDPTRTSQDVALLRLRLLLEHLHYPVKASGDYANGIVAFLLELVDRAMLPTSAGAPRITSLGVETIFHYMRPLSLHSIPTIRHKCDTLFAVLEEFPWTRISTNVLVILFKAYRDFPVAERYDFSQRVLKCFANFHSGVTLWDVYKVALIALGLSYGAFASNLLSTFQACSILSTTTFSHLKFMMDLSAAHGAFESASMNEALMWRSAMYHFQTALLSLPCAFANTKSATSSYYTVMHEVISMKIIFLKVSLTIRSISSRRAITGHVRKSSVVRSDIQNLYDEIEVLERHWNSISQSLIALKISNFAEFPNHIIALRRQVQTMEITSEWGGTLRQIVNLCFTANMLLNSTAVADTV
jgi:hypothetical protein